MAITIPRFAPTTTTALYDLLVDRRASIARSAESLRREAAELFSRRDLSDLLDQEDPAGDSVGAAALLLVERAERRLWEVEQALVRMAAGTYGYCTGCGIGIRLERLRALPATTSCVACSDRSSNPTNGRFEGHRAAMHGARLNQPSIRTGSGQRIVR